jgi:hypothetical protein
MSAIEATNLTRKLIHLRSSHPGESEWAMRELAREYGIGFWTLDHFRKGKAKTCDIGLFARLRAAYLDLCERQVKSLQHDIAIEKAKRGNDNDLQGLEAEADALALKIQKSRI